MKEREDKLDKLFKGYYKAQRPKIEPMMDTLYDEECHCELRAYSELEVCPDIGALGAYIEGSLSDTEANEIAAHLKSCKECREKVESASATMKDMRENRLEKTPDQLSSDTSSKLSKLNRKTPPK